MKVLLRKKTIEKAIADNIPDYQDARGMS